MKPDSTRGFWSSGSDEILINPRLPAKERRIFETAWIRARGRAAGQGAPRGGRIALATSGTSGALKLVLLAKPALLAAADGANRHVRATAGDVWLKALPDFHVGGLSIHARAFVSGARVVDVADGYAGRWSHEKFAADLLDSGATLTSLVPAQLFDLVRSQTRAPGRLRAVVVGGGASHPDLYAKARALGWPALPSYGLTECGSQVATAPLDTLASDAFPALAWLPHVEARAGNNGHVELRSAALLEGYLRLAGDDIRFDDPKRDGWFATEDIGQVDAAARTLKILGRSGDFIKIGGESVDLPTLEAKFEEAKLASVGLLADAAVLAVPDERLGSVIHLLHEGEMNDGLHRLVDDFNARVAPFERIRQTRKLSKIPRSSLGKLLRSAAVEELNRTKN